VGGALADPTSSATEQWDSGEAHAYKLTVTMNSASGAGMSATADFTWLAAST
jgi:hypothetical protein